MVAREPLDVEEWIGKRTVPRELFNPYRLGRADYGFRLLKHGKLRGHSHTGEYGVLKEIFRRLGVTAGICCEFGASNGMATSNTYDLIESHNWLGVMMETNALSYNALSALGRRLPRIRAFNETIHYLPGKGTLLDDFLQSIEMPRGFDLLSIDIDSCDYHVWKSLKNYKPKVVVIEVNNLDLDVIQREGVSHKHLGGSTCFPPMKKLGEEKGYTLVAYTMNMIFLRNDLVEKVRPQ
jgi:hypothetical protein